MSEPHLGYRYLLGAQATDREDVTWVGSVSKFLSASAWLDRAIEDKGVTEPGGKWRPAKKVVIFDSEKQVVVSSVQFGLSTWSN